MKGSGVKQAQSASAHAQVQSWLTRPALRHQTVGSIHKIFAVRRWSLNYTGFGSHSVEVYEVINEYWTLSSGLCNKPSMTFTPYGCGSGFWEHIILITAVRYCLPSQKGKWNCSLWPRSGHIFSPTRASELLPSNNLHKPNRFQTLHSSALKIDAAYFSETSPYVWRLQSATAQEATIWSDRHANFKSCNGACYLVCMRTASGFCCPFLFCLFKGAVSNSDYIASILAS
jgi:hypothetical protein